MPRHIGLCVGFSSHEAWFAKVFSKQKKNYGFFRFSRWSDREINGTYITITRRDDGSLRPNFKPMKVDADFSIVGYAFGVAKELIKALKGLIEEKAAD